jgi:hypothetical protein
VPPARPAFKRLKGTKGRIDTRRAPNDGRFNGNLWPAIPLTKGPVATECRINTGAHQSTRSRAPINTGAHESTQDDGAPGRAYGHNGSVVERHCPRLLHLTLIREDASVNTPMDGALLGRTHAANVTDVAPPHIAALRDSLPLMRTRIFWSFQIVYWSAIFMTALGLSNGMLPAETTVMTTVLRSVLRAGTGFVLTTLVYLLLSRRCC